MFRSLMTCITALLLSGPVAAQGKKGDFKSAAEAYDIGVTFIGQKNLAKAQEAFEAALELSPDEKLKGKILRAILIPYDKDKDFTKFVKVIEEVIRHPTTPAEKSNNRSDLLGFLQERKKEKEGAELFEAKLKKAPKDATVLYILSGIYGELLSDAKRAAELTERLAEVSKDAGGKLDPRITLQLARQYVKSGKLKEGAELFEKLADADPKDKAMHMKEAAHSWLKAGDKDKARAIAKAASKLGYENKNKQLAHFWNRYIGEVLLDTGEPELSIPHLEAAIELTTSDGYKKACQKLLEKAKQGK